MEVTLVAAEVWHHKGSCGVGTVPGLDLHGD